MADVQRDDAIQLLFQPRSVAVVGVSTDSRKWGHMTAQRIIGAGYDGTLSLVSRSGKQILGMQSVQTVAEIGSAPDLAVVTVPESSFDETIDDLLDLGTKAIVAVTVGFGETGAEGLARQEAVVRKVRDAGAVIIGPNCLGTLDTDAGFNCMAWLEEAPKGNVGLISNSGSVILEVVDRLKAVGLGVSRAAAVGNQADVTLSDLVRTCAADENTKVLIVYIEDVLDGRGLYREIARATAAGTPVVVLMANGGDAVDRAAKSHTGALVSNRHVVEEASATAGAVHVSSLQDAVHMAQALLSPARPQGYRTAIISDAGGLGILAASQATDAGLDLPVLPGDVQSVLAAQLYPGAGVSNPVDIVGPMNTGPVPSMVATVLQGDAIDSALVLVSAFSHDTPELEVETGRELAAVARDLGKPIALCATNFSSPGPRAAAESGLPVYRDIEPAVAALAALARMSERKPCEPPIIPPAASPQLTLDPADYMGARAALANAGIPYPRATWAANIEDAVGAADDLGYPVVVKALGLVHKSDAGGVALGLRSSDEVRAQVTRMSESLSPTGFAVEEMVAQPDGVELIIGARQDPRFGPMLLLGLGGVYTEVLRDTAVLMAPTSADVVIAKLRSLRGAALLLGARGKPAVDLEAAADCVVRLGAFIAEHPEVLEVDINPLLSGSWGALALDARIVI